MNKEEDVPLPFDEVVTASPIAATAPARKSLGEMLYAEIIVEDGVIVYDTQQALAEPDISWE